MNRYLCDGNFYDGMTEQLSTIVRARAINLGDNSVITKSDCKNFVEAYGSLIDIQTFDIKGL